MRTISVMIATGLVMAGIAGFAGTSEAAVRPCTENHACLYTEPNFTGDVFDVGSSATSLPALGIVSVSSIDNWDPDSPIAFYYNSGYRGPCFTVKAYGRVSDLGQVQFSDGTSADNRVSSFHFNRICGPVYDF